MRKELHLDEETTIYWLQHSADKKKWSLKKYMEQVLISDSEKIKRRLTYHADNPQQTEKSQVHQ